MSLNTSFQMADAGWDLKKNIFNKVKKIEIHTDGDGNVTQQELKNLTYRLKNELDQNKWKDQPKQEAKDALAYLEMMGAKFAEYDKNKDGKLSRDEVVPISPYPSRLGVMVGTPTPIGPTHPLAILSEGVLKHYDLYDAFEAADNGTTTHYRNAIGGKKVKRVDINASGGDGSITQDEVKDRLKSLNDSVVGRRFTDAGKKSYEKTKALLQSVLDRFSTIDTNNNGKIDKDER